MYHQTHLKENVCCCPHYSINYFCIRHKGHVPTTCMYFRTTKLHDGEHNYWSVPTAGTPVCLYLWTGTQASLVAYLEESRLDCTRIWAMPALVWVPGREALPCSPVSLARMLKVSGMGGWGQLPCAPTLFISKRQLLILPCIAVHTLKKQRNKKGQIFF